MTNVVMGTPLYPTVDVIRTSRASSGPPRPSLERRNTMTQVLQERGWPAGLTKLMASSIEQFPVRFIVVDNSGSMQSMDGSRLVRAPNGELRSIKATRWAELGDVVTELGEAVSALHAPTHFHLLNPSPEGQYFSIAESGEEVVHGLGMHADLGMLKRAMGTSPTGTTPLTESVLAVTQQIAPAAETLRAYGQKVVVVLATDGLPNDPRSFLQALQELQRLPVWLVVRLCTDEDAVVDYWSDLDTQLEAPLETLDDVAGESKEVFAKNPWLTCALVPVSMLCVDAWVCVAQSASAAHAAGACVCIYLPVCDCWARAPRASQTRQRCILQGPWGCKTSSLTCSTRRRSCHRRPSS